MYGRIKFDLLKNHPQWVGAAARLWIANIGSKWYPQDSYIETYERFHHQMNSDELPIAAIAHNGKNLIGLCNLGENFDLGEPFGPWLGALVVDRRYQGQGIGTQLINYTVSIATNIGLTDLYIFTVEPTIHEYYIKQGWSFVKSAQYKGLSAQYTGIPAKILKKTLKQAVA